MAKRGSRDVQKRQFRPQERQQRSQQQLEDVEFAVEPDMLSQQKERQEQQQQARRNQRQQNNNGQYKF